MVRSNQDAGHSTLFNTTMGTIAGAGMGAAAYVGADHGATAVHNKVNDAIYNRGVKTVDRIDNNVASGRINQSQATLHMDRLERTSQHAFDNSAARKVTRGMEKFDAGARRMKLPGGAIGAAAIGAGLIGGAIGFSKD